MEHAKKNIHTYTHIHILRTYIQIHTYILHIHIFPYIHILGTIILNIYYGCK